MFIGKSYRNQSSFWSLKILTLHVGKIYFYGSPLLNSMYIIITDELLPLCLADGETLSGDTEVRFGALRFCDFGKLGCFSYQTGVQNSLSEAKCTILVTYKSHQIAK